MGSYSSFVLPEKKIVKRKNGAGILRRVNIIEFIKNLKKKWREQELILKQKS